MLYLINNLQESLIKLLLLLELNFNEIGAQIKSFINFYEPRMDTSISRSILRTKKPQSDISRYIPHARSIIL